PSGPMTQGDLKADADSRRPIRSERTREDGPDQDGPEMPALIYGRSVRHRAVTDEQVMVAADHIARAHGIDALTIRRLCDELGITAPSIYVHFPGKEVIVKRLVDSILGRVHHPGPEQGDWVDRLREFIVSVYDQVVPYPGLAARIARQLPTTESSQRN